MLSPFRGYLRLLPQPAHIDAYKQCLTEGVVLPALPDVTVGKFGHTSNLSLKETILDPITSFSNTTVSSCEDPLTLRGGAVARSIAGNPSIPITQLS